MRSMHSAPLVGAHPQVVPVDQAVQHAQHKLGGGLKALRAAKGSDVDNPTHFPKPLLLLQQQRTSLALPTNPRSSCTLASPLLRTHLVLVYGADQRLKHVPQDGGRVLLAVAEEERPHQHPLVQPQELRKLVGPPPRDHHLAELRQRALQAQRSGEQEGEETLGGSESTGTGCCGTTCNCMLCSPSNSPDHSALPAQPAPLTHLCHNPGP